MFEKLKQDMLKKIETDAVKSELNGETVYLKKSRIPLVGDWARIYPPVNENGSWNIPNLIFGGKKNLIKLIIVLVIIAMLFAGIYQLIQGYEAILNQPCVQSCINPIKYLGY